MSIHNLGTMRPSNQLDTVLPCASYSSDHLIPEIHEHADRSAAWLYLFGFIFGT